MAEPRWLNPVETRAWRGWIELADLLRAALARDLWSASRVSDADYAVLVHLSEAPGRRVRMSDLAAALRWSKSRLSHQVGRMEARGLVTREHCPTDGRGAFAVLTGSGMAETAAAAPAHVESVRRHLIDVLSPEQQANLADIAETVLAHHRDQDSVGVPTAGGVAGKAGR